MRTKLASLTERLSLKGALAIGGYVLGVAIVVYTFVFATPRNHRAVESGGASAPQVERRKPVRAWNMALGNVVVVAAESGFSVKTAAPKGELDSARFLARIDSQLKTIRALYRESGEKNSALMGSLTLQLSVGAAGQVTDIKEVSSRIPDREFKQLIVAQARNWVFDDLTGESVTIYCPLLFVREGMDITTLVEWERALRQTDKNAAPTFSGASAINVPPTNFIPAAIERPVSKPATRRVEIPADVPAAQESEPLYQMNTASALRRQPHFSAPVITRLTIGAQVSVLNRRGDWLEIRTADAGLAGFVRKEFVTRSEPMRKQ